MDNKTQYRNCSPTLYELVDTWEQASLVPSSIPYGLTYGEIVYIYKKAAVLFEKEGKDASVVKAKAEQLEALIKENQKLQCKIFLPDME